MGKKKKKDRGEDWAVLSDERTGDKSHLGTWGQGRGRVRPQPAKSTAHLHIKVEWRVIPRVGHADPLVVFCHPLPRLMLQQLRSSAAYNDSLGQLLLSEGCEDLAAETGTPLTHVPHGHEQEVCEVEPSNGCNSGEVVPRDLKSCHEDEEDEDEDEEDEDGVDEGEEDQARGRRRKAAFVSCKCNHGTIPGFEG